MGRETPPLLWAMATSTTGGRGPGTQPCLETVDIELCVPPTMPPAPGHSSHQDGGLADVSGAEGSGHVTWVGEATATTHRGFEARV